MIIRRKKNAIYANLCVGIALIPLIFYLIFSPSEGFRLYHLTLWFLSSYYLALALYNWNTPLIALGADEIVFYTFPKKKSSYPTDLVRIQYSAGDYIFKTSNEKSYQISKSSIPTNQLDSFEEYVNMHNKNTGKEVHIVSV